MAHCVAMETAKKIDQSENEKQEALDVVEAARETEWEHPSFVAELFMGRIRSDIIFPFPTQSAEDKKIGDEYMAKISAYLKANLDPEEVDATGDLPQEFIKGLADLGAFGMKIPKKYGGLGFSQTNYDRVMAMICSYCTSTSVWLSAHQSIGLPQPLKMFGTEEQKQKYLPKLAAGAVSAFALTESGVGSDPAKMATTAVPTEDGSAYILNGEKLWCTNGCVAEYLVVIARTPPKIVNGKEQKQLTAFIVDRDMPGFEMVHRCDFMGLKGIQNAVLRFTNMRVPKENIIWKEGRGLKLALVTLNTGRLTLPAACIGGVKKCLEITRRWAKSRVQWGVPIGKHETISMRIARMNAGAFAMEAMTWLACAMVDKGGTDIRMEAAMAKMFCSETAWEIVNDTMQIKGGRGYETARSLKARGEDPDPVERLMRDSRINLIFEGSSEIMRLFLAREALDPHLKIAGALFEPRSTFSDKLKAVGRILGFYSHWYPRQWFYVTRRVPGVPNVLQGHYRFIQLRAHKLARSIVHAMGRFGPGLERRQMVLWRAVDIGTELFAMTATIARATQMVKDNPNDKSPIELADLFCRESRRKVKSSFEQFTSVDDESCRKLANKFLDDKLAWMEEGIV